MSFPKDLVSAWDMKASLRLRGVQIDGAVAARLSSYELNLERLVYAGLTDDQRASVAAGYDPGTKSPAQLRDAARADLAFLMQVIRDAPRGGVQ